MWWDNILEFQIYIYLTLDKNKPTEKNTSNLQTIIKVEIKRKREAFYYKVYQNRAAALALFCQLARWRYSIQLPPKNLYNWYKNSSMAKKMWQRRKGEDTVCCLEELGAVCVFWHSCHSPFEKCIKAIAELVGLDLGTQSRDHHPNLSGEHGGEWRVSDALLSHLIIKTSALPDRGNTDSCHFSGCACC